MTANKESDFLASMASRPHQSLATNQQASMELAQRIADLPDGDPRRAGYIAHRKQLLALRRNDMLRRNAAYSDSDIEANLAAAGVTRVTK